MDPSDKSALLATTLGRAAEQLGDITPHVYARYYAAYPEARGHFVQLQPEDSARLEGEMVEQILFCLMELPEDRIYIEIILLHTVPQHLEDLDLPLSLFDGLICAVRDVIGDLIPAANASERSAWYELAADLLGMVHHIARHSATAGANRGSLIPASAQGCPVRRAP